MAHGWRVAMCGQAGSKYASPTLSCPPVAQWMRKKGRRASRASCLLRRPPSPSARGTDGGDRYLEKCPARLQRKGKYGRTLRGSRRQRLIKALGSARTCSVPLMPKGEIGWNGHRIRSVPPIHSSPASTPAPTHHIHLFTFSLSALLPGGFLSCPSSGSVAPKLQRLAGACG